MTGMEQTLVGGIVALAAAVSFLFGLEQTRHKETKLRLDECESMRFNTAQRVARLEAGCHHMDCPLRKREGC